MAARAIRTGAIAPRGELRPLQAEMVARDGAGEDELRIFSAALRRSCSMSRRVRRCSARCPRVPRERRGSTKASARALP